MSKYLKYNEITNNSTNLVSLAQAIRKSNQIIEVMEMVECPISDSGIQTIESINKQIDSLNAVDPGDRQSTRIARSVQLDIDSFYKSLKDAAMSGFFESKDVIKFLSSKKSRDKALDNLKTQESIIKEYSEKLEAATNQASSKIEQATTGLLASKIQDRVNELSVNPETDKYHFLWIKRLSFYEKVHKNTDESKLQESAYYWYKKRQWSLRDLGLFIVLVLGLEVSKILEWIQFDITTSTIISLVVIKGAVFALLYARYYFAQKNYRVYASLLAKYNHMLVNAKMLSGYMEVKNKDPDLYSSLVEKVTTLIAQPVEDHHFKNTTDNDSTAAVFKNIVNDKIPNNQA